MHRTATLLTLVALIAVQSGQDSSAQSKYRGIPMEHRKYELGDGITSKDVRFYSDGVACFARLHFPKDYDPNGSYAGVVISQGWTGTSDTIHKYGNRFAENGLVAMSIDYRGWGESDGFVSVVDRVETDDATRRTETQAKVQIKRTRLVPLKQIEDIRAAISYLQGEPGVDRGRIGLWGSSYAGGHVLYVASIDPRVKAIVSQVSGIGGNGSTPGPVPMTDGEINDAIKRARTGEGGEFQTGFSTPRMVDAETARLAREYRPFLRIEYIPETVAALFLLAENEELIDNDSVGIAAYESFKGKNKKLVVYPGIGHFDIYIEDNFEQASTEAANWFKTYLAK